LRIADCGLLRARTRIRNPQSAIRNELTELAAACRHRAGPRRHRGVLFEELLVLVHDHVGTRAGRDDDGARRALEHADRVARNLARVGVESRVERRLAAAGLIRGYFDLAPETFEHAHGGHCDLGRDFVHEAGVKQLNVFRRAEALRHMVRSVHMPGIGVEPAALDV